MSETTQDSIRGVGGWLLLLVLGLLVVGPLLTVGSASTAVGSLQHESYSGTADLPVVVSVVWISTIASVAISLSAGLLLTARRQASTVKIVIFLLWAGGPILALFSAMALGVILDEVAWSLGYALPRFIATTVAAGIWTSYLTHSRRVHNTYAAQSENIGSVEIKSVPSAPSFTRPTPRHDKAVAVGAPVNQQEAPDSQVSDPLKQSIELPLSHAAATHHLTADEDLWAAALDEFESPSRRAGLWARLYSEADGNEIVVKANYLKARVAELAAARRDAERRAEASRNDAVRAEAIEVFLNNGRPSMEEIKKLVAYSKEDRDIASLADRMHGNTVLHWCATFGLHREAVELLERGANAGRLNGNGDRAYDLATDLTLRDELLKAAHVRQEVEADEQRRLNAERVARKQLEENYGRFVKQAKIMKDLGFGIHDIRRHLEACGLAAHLSEKVAREAML